MGSDSRLLARVALALFVFGLVVPQSIIAATRRYDGAQILAALCLLLSVFFALWSWRERLSKAVLLGVAIVTVTIAVTELVVGDFERDQPLKVDYPGGPVPVPAEPEGEVSERSDAEPDDAQQDLPRHP